MLRHGIFAAQFFVRRDACMATPWRMPPATGGRDEATPATGGRDEAIRPGDRRSRRAPQATTGREEPMRDVMDLCYRFVWSEEG